MHCVNNGVPVYASAECVELLARGPEDFAEDVELVSWEQWLKGESE
jgi:hypothetical protein